MKIGIRREDKSQWEVRTPLVPDDIKLLVAAGLQIFAQPSSRRVFTDTELEEAGAILSDELDECDVVMGIKEIPVELLRPETTYIFFSHTTKGQLYNMPMLRRLMDLRCSLIDYERIVDAQGQRLVSFSRFAGLAGLLDALWLYGRRISSEGTTTLLSELKQTLAYRSLDEAQAHLAEVARKCRNDKSFEGIVIGILGMGRVGQGALAMARSLSPRMVEPQHLITQRLTAEFNLVVFHTEHLIERLDGGPVDLQVYRRQPEMYRSALPNYLSALDVVLNGIYWEPRFPRMIRRSDIHRLWVEEGIKKPKVIADVTCDVDGAIELTTHARHPGAPSYVYDTIDQKEKDGIEGDGPVLMTNDILPNELPRESSQAFSETLVKFMSPLAAANSKEPLNKWELPVELKRALILHRGQLQPEYRYLSRFVTPRQLHEK